MWHQSNSQYAFKASSQGYYIESNNLCGTIQYSFKTSPGYNIEGNNIDMIPVTDDDDDEEDLMELPDDVNDDQQQVIEEQQVVCENMILVDGQDGRADSSLRVLQEGRANTSIRQQQGSRANSSVRVQQQENRCHIPFITPSLVYTQCISNTNKFGKVLCMSLYTYVP